MARYAVLATINSYKNSDLTPLSFAQRDGEVLEQLLIERGGFKTLRLNGHEATRERILEALIGQDQTARWPAFTRDDLLLFFFAGHGELVGGSYVLHGFQARAGTSTYSVALRDVADMLKRQVSCQQCACILDACRNLARPGARGVAALDGQSARDIKAVASASNDEFKLVEMLYGCDEGQVSMEDAILGHGVLTYHIAQVIRENRCSTMQDLFDEAADRMRAWSRGRGHGQQEPQLYRPGGRRRVTLFPQVVTFVAKPGENDFVSIPNGEVAQPSAASKSPPASSVQPKASAIPEARLSGPRAITNFIGMKFVQVMPDTFMMGSRKDEVGRYGDENLHKVMLTRGFMMATTPVTQAQWKAVMGNNPSHFQGDDLPVEQVSWNDAADFCKKLNDKEKDRHYRLPTEAEWEYACRAGTTTAYYLGDGVEALKLGAWCADNSGDNPINSKQIWDTDSAHYVDRLFANHNRTHPVGQKQPNGWGLYDMLGNVWHWCSDRYGEYANGEATDPQGPAAGDFRVLRGGSWSIYPRCCRCAKRYDLEPDCRYDILGFRVVLDSE